MARLHLGDFRERLLAASFCRLGGGRLEPLLGIGNLPAGSAVAICRLDGLVRLGQARVQLPRDRGGADLLRPLFLARRASAAAFSARLASAAAAWRPASASISTSTWLP